MPSESSEMEKVITELWHKLHLRFGRPPTDEEVTRFILGDQKERERIYNFGLPHTIKKEGGNAST